MLHRPTEDHIVDLALAGFALHGIAGALVGADRRFEVGDAADGVDRRLLDNDPAVDQALEVDEAVLLELGQAVDASDLNDP